MASFGFRANKSSLINTSACEGWNNHSSLCSLWTKKAQLPTKCCYKPPAGKSHRSSSPGPQTLPFLIVSSDSSSSLKYESASMAPSLLRFSSLEQFWACVQRGHATARGCRKWRGFGGVNYPSGTPSICAGVLDLSQAEEMPRAVNLQTSSNYEALRKDPFTPSSMQTHIQGSCSARALGGMSVPLMRDQRDSSTARDYAVPGHKRTDL